jgi:hypothetical protein
MPLSLSIGLPYQTGGAEGHNDCNVAGVPVTPALSPKTALTSDRGPYLAMCMLLDSVAT